MSSLAELEELERKIAQLEKEVDGGEVSDDDDEDDDDDDVEELEPIPHLPSHLLCAPGLLLGGSALSTSAPPLVAPPASSSAANNNNDADNAAQQEAEEIAEEVDPSAATAANKRIVCKLCENTVYWGEAAFRKHSRTVKHRQNVILKAGEGYEAANKASNFCRACNFQAEETEELMLHRKTPMHLENAAALARASMCQLCRKQFTSPLQLREHIIGKAHKDMVEAKTGFRPADDDAVNAVIAAAAAAPPPARLAEAQTASKEEDNGKRYNNDHSNDHNNNNKRRRRQA